tara:strand:+ start:168 stop:572 length:405 start_codon:yes stop_codon:yes gene_type:complete
MKKLIYISVLLTFSFSCKKAEVRKGIEGLWKIEKFTYNIQYPGGIVSGTYEFFDCSRKENKEVDCIVSRTFVPFFYDSIYPERTQSYSFQVINRGKEITIGKTKYRVDLNDYELVLYEILEEKGLAETITLSRQ